MLEDLIGEPGECIDLLVVCLGYEERALAISKKLEQTNTAEKYAIGFPESTIHNYQDNKSWFEDNDFTVAVQETSEIKPKLVERFRNSVREGETTLSVVIDISCFSSERLAAIVEAIQLFIYQEKITVSVRFYYSMAVFSPHLEEFVPNRLIGAISPFFSGWKNSTHSDHVAILGLGYEIDKALGVREYLEPKDAWLFVPTSIEKRYLDHVLKANQTLLHTVSAEKIISYSVMDPFQSFSKLASLCQSLSDDAEPILVPFGPKIFVLISLLVAIEQFNVPVWRVSNTESEQPENRISSGHFVGLSVIFKESVLN